MHGRTRAFTLIEVLVALVVVAVAVAALARAGSQSLTLHHELDRRTLALWVADNHLAELALDGPLAPGSASGAERMAGRDWHWRSRIRAAPGGSLWRVDVQVYAGADGDRPVLEHTGFLPR